MIEIDEGFYFGMGAFETLAVKNGVALMCKEHLARLHHSLKFFNISNVISEVQIREFIARHQFINGVLKIAVSEKNIDISVRENPYTGEIYRKGFHLWVSSFPRNEASLLTSHKTLNYAENIIAKRIALSHQAQEALFLNTKGEISEGSSSNIFFIKGKQLFTPSKDSGILPGIMREIICAGENVQERKITLSDLSEFEECFITNSVIGVMKVCSIGNHTFTSSELTEKLRNNYSRYF